MTLDNAKKRVIYYKEGNNELHTLSVRKGKFGVYRQAGRHMIP